jgi:hypothetical protein
LTSVSECDIIAKPSKKRMRKFDRLNETERIFRSGFGEYDGASVENKREWLDKLERA